MPAMPPTGSAIPNRYKMPLLLVLVAAGLAGNYFNFEIFLNINFLFGSIFALLALQFFGIGRGILAAAIIAGYTWILWYSPYAIIIMTAEVAVVGWLMGRRKIGMVLADTLYWLIIGMPMTYFFYHFVMPLPPSNIHIIIIKLAVNGIANALVARLIFTVYALRSCSLLMSYSEIVYNLLTFFVLCPTLVLLAIGSRTDFAETDRHIRTSLIQDSRRNSLRLETWVLNRKSAIINLAEMAASKSPQQMQPYLELIKKSDVNFQRVGLLNREATVTAYFPLSDELGQDMIGNSYADRPFFPMFKRNLKPMLSEVVMGRVGIPKPIVLMIAPVIIHGEYGGYVAGTLSMEQIREHLEKSADNYTLLYTLIDKNGNVIMSNRTDQTVMTAFVRGKGTLNRLDKVISQWVPIVPPNTSVTERWGKSFYVAQTAIGDMAEWRLILEQPVAPFQKLLYNEYADKLSLLFLILLGALALAGLLSRRIVAPMKQLRTLTNELPVRLTTDAMEIVWPESGMKEAHHLINNFREMADSLSNQFNEVRRINESLEQRVKERTAEREQFFTFFITSADLMCIADPNGAFKRTNPAFSETLGYSEAELVSKPFVDFVHPDDKQMTLDEMKRQIAIGYTLQFENRYICKDGSLCWLSWRAVHHKDTHVTYAIARNATERKQAEEALRNLSIYNRTLIEANLDSLATIDHNGKISDVNSATEQMTGYRRRELIGTDFYDYISEPEKAREGYLLVLKEGVVRDYPLEIRHLDGHVTPVLYNASVYHDESGNILGVFASARDISERKKSEQKLLESNRLLKEAREQAESANRAKSSFLANMSHEIRTPMNGVLGMTQLLEMTNLTEKQCEYLAAITLSGKNLMYLINDILDLSKIEAGKTTLELAEFSLHQSIKDVVMMQKFATDDKGLLLDTALSGNVPDLLVGDQLRVRQILHNLLGNAVKFTERGGVIISTQLLEQYDASVLVQITVRDTGIGISPDSLENIFEPFVQEDSSTTRKYGGTGLGLTISRRLVELMGGSISVESSPGGGSCFMLTLPFSIRKGARATPVDLQKTTVLWDGPPLRILLVEDDKVNITLGESLLKKLGHDAVTVENGRECLTALERGEFDIVLMDIQMPVMNGEEALQEIRRREQGTSIHLPVIALTAYSLRGERERFIKDGFDGYVSKPLEISKLVVEMKKVMEKAKG